MQALFRAVWRISDLAMIGTIVFCPLSHFQFEGRLKTPQIAD